MRTIYRLNGKMVNPDSSATIDDIFYPRLLPFADQIGLETAEVDDFPDLRLFDCTEDEAGNLTITPKYPAIIAAQEKAEANRLILVQIESLEAEITERRKREAILLVEGAMDWLKAQDEKIAALRATLK